MRASRRDRIIARVLEFAHRDGFDVLAFDALAEHIGLTRDGVIYYFRTKTELLEGIVAVLQERWRAEAPGTLGRPLEGVNHTECIEVLVRSVLDDEILPEEVNFILPSTPQAEMIESVWDMLRNEWIDEVDELSAIRRVALLTMNGWWASHAVNSCSCNPDEPVIVELIVFLACDEAGDDGRQ